MKVLILHSDVPENAPVEEQDTLWQVELVQESIKPICTTETRPFKGDFNTLLDLKNFDLVFNLVESVFCANRMAVTVPLFLESLKIGFTGCNSNSIYLSTDKVLLSRYLKLNEVSVPRLLSDSNSDTGVWIRKTRYEDGSVGINTDAVTTSVQIDNSHSDILQNNDFFYEEYLPGEEYSVSYHPKYGYLPVARIPFSNSDPTKPKILHYELKWDGESAEYLGTLPLFDVDPIMENKLVELSKRILSLTDTDNYCRIDFRLDIMGTPNLIDLNPNCCLSHESIFNLALQKKGFSVEEAIREILKVSLK